MVIANQRLDFYKRTNHLKYQGNVINLHDFSFEISSVLIQSTHKIIYDATSACKINVFHNTTKLMFVTFHDV